MSINNKLEDLYSQHWPDLLEQGRRIGGPEPTSPMLLSVDDKAFPKASKRIVICGQETLGWKPFGGSVADSMAFYHKFFIEQEFYKGYGRSAFWKAFRYFERELRAAFAPNECVFIYQNLCKMGRNDGVTGVTDEIRKLERKSTPTIPGRRGSISRPLKKQFPSNNHTSRAKNPAWYQQAMELDLQLHIRPDGPGILTAYYDRTSDQWSEGPKLTEDILRDSEAFEPIVTDILSHAKDSKASSLGVILHIADEFATAELNPELDNPGGLTDLSTSAAYEPASILEDSSINPADSSFRIVPYSAAGSDVVGTTITVSRQYDDILNLLRETGEKANFPIITQSVSAPLLAILALPNVLKAQPEKPFVLLLQYPWFTGLAFFNEHADLKLIRTLQHRGLRQASNLRNALFTTCASLEFMDPDLYIMQLGEMIDDELAGTLRQHFAGSTVETLELPQAQGLPRWAPEPIIINNPPDESAAVSSMTFTTFMEDQWATQDFLPMAREQAEIYPFKGEISMLRVARLVRILVIVLAAGALGYLGIGMWGIMKMPEWSFDPGKANASQVKLSKLNAEQRRATHLSNILQDRSQPLPSPAAGAPSAGP